MRKGSGSPMCIDCGVRPRASKSIATCHECHQKRYAYRLGKKCPDCDKPILDKASICRHCRYERIRHAYLKHCEYCGKEFSAVREHDKRFCNHACANRARETKPFNVERFWAKVDRRGPDECWVWKGTTTDGYGRVYYQGAARQAHCVAYILTYGSIPDGLFLRHKCDNRPCVNPAHLIPGTHWDNMRDVAEHRRLRQSVPRSGFQTGEHIP